MTVSRLRTALEGDPTFLGDGAVDVMRPPADYDLPIEPGRLRVLTGDRVTYEALSARGLTCADAAPEAPVRVLVMPRSKSLGRAMIAAAARLPGRVIVDGQKTDGIDSHYKAVRKALGDLGSLTKAHGRLFWFDAPALADWPLATIQTTPAGFATQPGVFSEDGPDKGSLLLAGALPTKLGPRVADLGAGWGYLAKAILTRDGVETLDLYEAEARALDCARHNIQDPRANLHWADVTRLTKGQYDTIVMNPPFHTGRTGDPGLGQAFITTAARLLAPKGTLWMVANRHLPYEVTLGERFAEVREIGHDGGFKLLTASRPRR